LEAAVNSLQQSAEILKTTVTRPAAN
jgi:hypothetical protein